MLYVLATWMRSQHAFWAYAAAFAEAAMVGAVADWFAVVALFRRPLGLPIPHTGVIVNNKNRIGTSLADFVVTHFFTVEQLMLQLEQIDVPRRMCIWLQDFSHARQAANQLAGVGLHLFAVLDVDWLQEQLTIFARRGLQQLDWGKLSSRLLDDLMHDDRHQRILDGVLLQIARLLASETVQEQMIQALTREVRFLKILGLDQVAARAVMRKLIGMIAQTLIEVGSDPEHELRQRFDALVQDYVQRLKEDEGLRRRVSEWADQLLSNPDLSRQARQLCARHLNAWMQDLKTENSPMRLRLAEILQTLARHWLQNDAAQDWVQAQIRQGLPDWLARHRDDIRAYIEAQVKAWDARQMSAELERQVGRDLQFIRINGTLVGGMVGLLIYSVTQWVS